MRDAHPSTAEFAVRQLTFMSTSGIALLGALVCLVLVRRTTRVAEGPIFSRRSRWIFANVASTPAVTKQPPPPDRT